MTRIIIALVGSQLLYTTGDLLARHHMSKQGFTLATFITWWFFWYTLVRVVATFGQLYVFSSVEIGKVSALFGALSIILANVLGLLLFKEVLSSLAYVGVMFALLSFVIIAITL